MKTMHHNHENPALSILFGGLFGIYSFLSSQNFMMDFGVDLLKVCIFGFAGGIFGLIGKRVYMKIFPAKNKEE